MTASETLNKTSERIYDRAVRVARMVGFSYSSEMKKYNVEERLAAGDTKKTIYIFALLKFIDRRVYLEQAPDEVREFYDVYWIYYV